MHFKNKMTRRDKSFIIKTAIFPIFFYFTVTLIIGLGGILNTICYQDNCAQDIK